METDRGPHDKSVNQEAKAIAEGSATVMAETLAKRAVQMVPT
jgi:hypothetical protein